MGDPASIPDLANAAKATAKSVPGPGVRHAAVVRVTHWITAFCIGALLLSGLEIVVSHPRFYWGEEGTVNTPALFHLPIPASRKSVPTGYGYTLEDQNGWSRSLHFQSAWFLVGAGAVYGMFGLCRGHFRNRLLPARDQLSPKILARVVLDHLRLKRPGEEGSYNPLQRIAYLSVIFGAVPVMIWTGLAMSPAVTSAWPFLVDVLGGHQSARTIHFFGTLVLVMFVVVHVLMVCLAGFRQRMRAMIIGR